MFYAQLRHCGRLGTDLMVRSTSMIEAHFQQRAKMKTDGAFHPLHERATGFLPHAAMSVESAGDVASPNGLPVV
jgi:hypothetical protein